MHLLMLLRVLYRFFFLKNKWVELAPTSNGRQLMVEASVHGKKNVFFL